MSTQARASNDVLFERIEAIRHSLDQLTALLQKHIDAQYAYERDSLLEHARLDQKASAAHVRLDEQKEALAEKQRQIDEHQARLEEINELTRPLRWIYRMMWIVVGLALSGLFSFLYAILTHKVTIVVGQ